MITIDDIFAQIFPWMEGISIDLGTILIALVFLSFLVLGFDYVMQMLGTRMQTNRNSLWADNYYKAAESARQSRDTWNKDSIEWEEQNSLYKKFLNKSTDARASAWKY